MAEGQYVRAPIEDDSDQSGSEEPIPEACAFVSVEDSIEDGNTGSTREAPRTGGSVNAGEANVTERMNRLERAFVDLTQAILDKHRETQESAVGNTRNDDASWTVPDANREAGSSNIRWDHIKPFPSNVPAREMWQTWHRYLETFEIAATFSNANDPARRTQLLFLAMGESLQKIVRAAGLKPNLADPTCYNKFVNGIGEFLKSMTDSSVEHDSFLNMYQQKGESVVCFHARLTEKVRACGYHPEDQGRFVRTQLLKGMSNHELAKTARTYGHDTAMILQAATRSESYEKEPEERAVNREVYSMNRIVYPAGGASRKRPYREEEPNGANHADRYQPKAAQGRPNQCSRCNRATTKIHEHVQL